MLLRGKGERGREIREECEMLRGGRRGRGGDGAVGLYYVGFDFGGGKMKGGCGFEVGFGVGDGRGVVANGRWGFESRIDRR